MDERAPWLKEFISQVEQVARHPGYGQVSAVIQRGAVVAIETFARRQVKKSLDRRLLAEVP